MPEDKDEKALATFRIDGEKWKAFKEMAKSRDNATASQLIVNFIDAYLAGAPAASRHESPSDIDSRLAALEARLDAMEGKGARGKLRRAA